MLILTAHEPAMFNYRIEQKLYRVWSFRKNIASPHFPEYKLILRKQISNLKGLLANKTMEVGFFRRALQKVGARRRQSTASGATASMTK